MTFAQLREKAVKGSNEGFLEAVDSYGGASSASEVAQRLQTDRNSSLVKGHVLAGAGVVGVAGLAVWGNSLLQSTLNSAFMGCTSPPALALSALVAAAVLAPVGALTQYRDAARLGEYAGMCR
jgi:hypothetical protein